MNQKYNFIKNFTLYKNLTMNIKNNNRTETINVLHAQFPTKEKNNLAFPCTTNLLFMLNEIFKQSRKQKSKIKNKIMGNI